MVRYSKNIQIIEPHAHAFIIIIKSMGGPQIISVFYKLVFCTKKYNRRLPTSLVASSMVTRIFYHFLTQLFQNWLNIDFEYVAPPHLSSV